MPPQLNTNKNNCKNTYKKSYANSKLQWPLCARKTFFWKCQQVTFCFVFNAKTWHASLNKLWFFFEQGKGQLISKCLFGIIVWTKIPTKLFLDFCPEFFCSFLGASWKLFGLPGDLVCNIINKEAYRKPQKASRKPPGSYKKFQGRNRAIISLVFWKKFSDQKDILKLTDL